MSNEATIGFDCSQSRVWLQQCFRRVYVRNDGASMKGGNMDEEGWGRDEKSNLAP